MANWKDVAKTIVNSGNTGSKSTASETSGTKSSGGWQSQAKQILEDRDYVEPEKRMYELKTDTKSFGTVSYGAYKAVTENKPLIISDYVPSSNNMSKNEYNRRRASNPSMPEFGSYEYFKNREEVLRPMLDEIADDADRYDDTYKAWAENYANGTLTPDKKVYKLGKELYEKFKYQDAVLAEYKDVDTQLKKFDKDGIHYNSSLDIDTKSGAAEAKYAKERLDAIVNATTFTNDEMVMGVYGELPEDRQKEYDNVRVVAGKRNVEAEKEEAYGYYDKNKDKNYENNLWGRITGNYKVGRIGIKANDAGYTSYKANTDDIEATEVYQALSAHIQNRNKATFQNNNAAEEITAIVAQYAPQGVDQAVHKAVGSLIGAGIGAASGAGAVETARVGGSTAVAAYMYRQTAGAAFVRLLQESDLSVEDAKALANSEALASSAVEFGLDYVTSGLWKGVGSATKGATTKLGEKTTSALIKAGVSEKGAKTILNVAKNAGKLTLDALGEGTEEWIQEGMSITADRFAAEGESVSPFKLFTKSFDLTQYSKEDFSRMNQSFLAGTIIGFGHGGLNAATSFGINKAVSAAANAVDTKVLGEEINSSGETTIITDAVATAKESVSADVVKAAETVKNAMAENKEPPAEAVGTIVKDAIISAEEKTQDNIEAAPETTLTPAPVTTPVTTQGKTYVEVGDVFKGKTGQIKNNEISIIERNDKTTTAVMTTPKGSIEKVYNNNAIDKLLNNANYEFVGNNTSKSDVDTELTNSAIETPNTSIENVQVDNEKTALGELPVISPSADNMNDFKNVENETPISVNTPIAEKSVTINEITPETRNITLSQIGDFYEAYGDDAVELAEKLNLQLTPKNINGQKVQMVGFPVHVFDKYKSALGSNYNLTVSSIPTVTNINRENTQNENTDINNTAETSSNVLPNDTESDIIKETSQQLTRDEDKAIKKYKSSDSYLLNVKMREETPFSDSDRKFIADLNSALDKFDSYTGYVYRHIGFYTKDEFDKFVSQHQGKSSITYDAFTSSSKTVDGYLIDDTPYKAHFRINSVNGKDLSNLGLKEEAEILFKSGTAFNIHDVRVVENEIYLDESENVGNDGNEQGFIHNRSYEQNIGEIGTSDEPSERYIRGNEGNDAIRNEGTSNDRLSQRKPASDRYGNLAEDVRNNNKLRETSEDIQAGRNQTFAEKDGNGRAIEASDVESESFEKNDKLNKPMGNIRGGSSTNNELSLEQSESERRRNIQQVVRDSDRLYERNRNEPHATKEPQWSNVLNSDESESAENGLNNLGLGEVDGTVDNKTISVTEYNSYTNGGTAYGYGKNGALLFDAIVETEQADQKEVHSKFQRAYETGFMGVEDADFTDSIEQRAYKAGMTDLEESLNNAIVKSKEANVQRKNGGLIKTEASKKVQKQKLRLMDELGKTLGVKIKYAEQVYGGKANGSYKNGAITIALDAVDDFFVVAKHEITHFMQLVSPKEYFVYRNHAVQTLSDKRGVSATTLVEDYQKRANSQGVNLTVEQAMDEIAADFTEDILTNESDLRTFLESMSETKQKRNVMQKFFDAVRDFVDKVRKIFNGNKAKMDSVALSKYGATVEQLERAEQLWKYLLKATSDKVKTAETKQTGKSTADNSGVQYSLSDKLTKSYNDDIIYNDNEYGLTSDEWSEFYRSIGELKRKMWFPQTPSGDYIVEAGDKLVFTDGNYLNPSVNDVIVFKELEAEEIEFGKEIVLDVAQRTESSKEYCKAVEDVFGEGVIASRKNGVSSPDKGSQKYKSERGSSGEVVSKSKINNLDKETFSLKNSNYSLKNSVESDSSGRKLSEAQTDYFKDSKEVDSQGNLKVMYRGDANDINVFDRKKSRYSNLYGRGFYFTDSKSSASQYGKATEYYLNIKNPLSRNQNNITKAQMLKFLKAIENNGKDYDLYNYGENATAESVLDMVWGKDDFEMIQDISASAIGDLVEATEFFNQVNGTDYDGFILPTESIIFKSEQAKLTSNLNPTDNTDVRFSLKNQSDLLAENKNVSFSISQKDVEAVQSIERKSVNDFTSKDIKKTENFAKSYLKEMTTKSPFFRAWFGDWRANDKTPIKVVTEKGATRGIHKNIDTGWDIQVSGKVFNETTRQKSANKVTAIPFLQYIDSIVENAVLLDSYSIPSNKAKSSNSVMMHSMYALADTGNDVELIKMYVEELNDVNSDGTIKRSYQLNNIAKAPVASARVQGNSPSPVTSTTSADEYSISDLFNFVKRFDKNFNPKPASKVVNEDGTPKVVYHGTENFGFTVFDSSKTDDGLSLFFTDDEGIASTYSGAENTRGLSTLNNIDVKNMGGEKLAGELNSRRTVDEKSINKTYEYYTSEKVNELIKSINSVKKELKFYLNKADISNESDVVQRHAERLTKALKDNNDQDISTPLYMLLHHSGLFRESADLSAKFAKFEQDVRLMLEITKQKGTEVIVASELGGYDYEAFTLDTARFFLLSRPNRGNYAVYLDMKNPLIVKADDRYWNDIGFKTEEGQILDKTRDIAKYAKSKGYDGVVFNGIADNGGHNSRIEYNHKSNVYIAFDSTQIKSATDNIGTFDGSNPDVRFSLKNQSDLLAENKKLQEVNEALRKEFELTKIAKVDAKALNSFTNKLLNEYNSAADREKIKSGLDDLFTYMANGEEDFAPAWEEVRRMALDVSTKILESSTVINDDLYQEYSKLRKELRTRGITIDKRYNNDLTGYESINDFRKANFGRIKIVNDGIHVDVLFQELSEKYPEFFDSSEWINQADQLMRIEEVLDSFKPEEYNPYESEMKESATWVMNDIISKFFDLPQAKPTFADKTYEKLVNQKIKDAKKLENLRNQKNKRISELIRKNTEKIKEVGAKERAKKYEAIAETKARYDAKIEKASERRKVSVLKKKITTHINKISNMLLKGNDRSHIPEEMRSIVGAFLAEVDLTTKRQTEKTISRLNSLRNMYQRIADKKSEVDVEFDPDLTSYIEDVATALSRGNDSISVSELNSTELNVLYRVILAVERSIYTHNRAMAEGKNTEISALGNSVISENTTDKLYKEHGGITQAVIDTVNMDMLNPQDFFIQLGPTMKGMFQLIRDGFDKKIHNLEEAKTYLKKLLKDEDIATLSDKKAVVRKFKTEGGQTIELTPAQVMSLYLLQKQPDAHDHIYKGGIRQAPVVAKKSKGKPAKILKSYEVVKVTPNDVANIIKSLTLKQIKIADGISQFFVEKTSAWGNEVTMALYGYNKFTVNNYFPIVSDNNYIADIFGETTDATLKNMGSTKSRIKGANNPVMIEDAFDVFVRQADSMSSYNAFVIPLSDIQRVFNYKTREGSVKQAIEKKYGVRATSYFKKLMTDINGGARWNGGSQLLNTFISKYKQAKIGVNLRVVLQQPTAYLRAGAVIDNRYLLKSLKTKSSADIDTVYKYAPIALWKNWGFYSMDTARQLKDIILDKKNLADYTMAGAQKMDELTWKRLWTATELEIRDTQKELKVGSEEYYQAVGKRFSEIIDRTQVVDSVLHRSQILRNPDTLVKMSVSFMSEPLKAYNMLRTAVSQYKNNPEKATKHLLWSASIGYLSSIVVNNLVTALIDTIRGDDDDETWLEKILSHDEDTEAKGFLERYLWNFFDNITNEPLSMFPYVKDIASLVRGYDVKRMDMQGMSDLVVAAKYLSSDKYTTPQKIAIFGSKLGDLFGVPLSNIKRDVESITKTVIGAIGNPIVEYNVDKGIYTVKGNSKRYLDILYEAYVNSDEETFKYILEDILNNGIKPSEIESGIKNRAKKSDFWKQGLNGALKGFVTPTIEKKESDTFTVDDLNASEYKSYITKRDNLYSKSEAYLKKQSWYNELSADEKNKFISDLKGASDKLIKKSFSDDFDMNNKRLDAIYNNGSQANDIVDLYLTDKYLGLTADANNDDKVEKPEYIDKLSALNLDNDTTWDLYLSKYDSTTARNAKKYGIDAKVYIEGIVEINRISEKYKGKGREYTETKRAEIIKYLDTHCRTTKEWLYLYGTEYGSIKDEGDYIQYFGKQND